MNIQSSIEFLTINYGYIGVFISVLLEYANVPVPSEIVLPLIGFLSFEYNLNLSLIIAISVMAGIVGSLLNYYIGFKFGKYILTKLPYKYKFLKRPIEFTKQYATSYSRGVILTSRVIPLARTAISLVAGAYKIPLRHFILDSAVGILAWNSILIFLGFTLKNNFKLIQTLLSKYSIICIVILVLIFIYILYKLKFKQENKINYFNKKR